ncbi:MAG TPA: TetR/AcrR family transcriptional regulator [Actinomycetes bacterium]|jgi:AcrR family transcriptional regulator|nr:TetR/AcrR family transcriptional regulator [Actinomycetes bacterium]
MTAEADRAGAPPDVPCGPARRRGETLERAIFDAVVHQLQTVGYVGLTMEGIAACARTGKAALYRRWPSRDELVVDALEHTLPSLTDLADHGNLRDDLLDVLRKMAAMINSPTGCALRCLLAEIDRDHPFVRLVHERVLKPRKQLFHTVLQRAIERGEVRTDAIKPLVTEVGPAMLMQRFLADSAVPDAYVVSVVDDVVLPLLRR